MASCPGATDFKLHAKHLSLVLGCKEAVCPAIRNELVAVVVGSLFVTQQECHLQATSNFIMPSESDKGACAKASG